MKLRFLVLACLLGSSALHAAYDHPATARRAMVTSAHPLATDAGLAMLKAGGNAVDAAVATAFAISVVEPFSAGIGGGGFLLLHLNKTKQIFALDFRETAPAAASRDMYLDPLGKVREGLSLNGYLSVATPGVVAGLYEAHHKYGRLPWSKTLAPAIKLAQEGFAVDWKFVQHFALRQDILRQNPEAWSIFTHKGQALHEGDVLVQTDLSKTLKAIAKNKDAFYSGSVGNAIALDMAKNGGLVTLGDLKNYQPKWRQPICGSFRERVVCSMPPPSSGGVVLVEMLNLFELLEEKPSWHTPKTLNDLTGIMKTAYADRAEYLGDPAFVDNPVAKLTSKTYAKQRFDQLKPTKRESDDTSHLNVIDDERNGVSLTFTVNYNFGSGVVTPGTGVLLNDEMDDFAAAPGVPNAYGLVGSTANAVAPNKIPLSSMTPTLGFQDGKLAFAVGSPGGSRIISTVFQIITNLLVYNMNASDAVSTPRIHHQWQPNQLMVEAKSFDPATLDALRSMGHDILERPTWCNANLIVVKPDQTLEGAADPRGVGSAKGF